MSIPCWTATVWPVRVVHAVWVFSYCQNRAEYCLNHFIGSHVFGVMFIVMWTPIEAVTRVTFTFIPFSLQNAWHFFAIYFMTSKPLNRYSIWCGNWIYHFCTLSTLRWAHTTTIIISHISYERNNFIVPISVGLLVFFRSSFIMGHSYCQVVAWT